MPALLRRGCFLVAFLAVSAGNHPAVAQQQDIDLTLHLQLGRATQIVIPQSRGFMVNPVVEQRGSAIVVDSVEAHVKILEQTASTTMEINLRNPGPQQTQAIVLVPVPDGAVVNAFAFEGAASEPTMQILSRDEARRLYDAIVAKVRDPALLEFAGYNLIRSSVFPIPAGGTQKVRLTYDHILTADGNRVDYVLPRSESLDRRSPWRINVDIQAKHPISTVYSPSHDIQTNRIGPMHVAIKLLENSRLDPGPFLVSYLLERGGNDVSASMFAYPDPKVAPNGGYFLLMAGLPASISQQSNPTKREVTIVIDRSGSMAGGKMDQARAAALQVVEGLSEGEAFNIIDYSTTVSSFSPRSVVKDGKNILEARKYIANIHAGGGTNIHDALLEALRQEPIDNALPIMLFLTDGLPTVGNTSEVAIRELVEKGNSHHRRIFTFGVGNDVNVPVLDRIADITRATTTFVLPEEDVEVKVAAVFKRLYGPVLADLAIQTLGDQSQVSTRLVRELIPAKLPDLFEGDQLILLGQYQDKGPIRFKLAGNYLGQPRKFEFEFDMSAGATTKNAFVPRLWASRRIAYLVDQIRQAGAASSTQPNVIGASILSDPRYRELTDEILRLSTQFGILTEYTAFLATEGTNLGDWSALREACNSNLDNRAVKTRSGVAAVNQGMNFNYQKSKGCSNTAADNRFVDDKLNRVEITNVQQVCDRAFFRRGEQWIDSGLIDQSSEGQKNLTPDVTIDFGSPEHLELLHKLIAQNRQGVLSLDGDIIIQFEGRNILVRNASSARSN